MNYKIIRVAAPSGDHWIVEFEEPRRYNPYFRLDRASLLDRISNLERQGMDAKVEYDALAELNTRVKQEKFG